MCEEQKKEHEEFLQFIDPKKWKDGGAGNLKREPMDAVPHATFEIIKNGEDTYQTKVWIIGTYEVYGNASDSMEDAKKFAWDCYMEILQLKKKREDDSPSSTNDMCI